MHRTTGRFPLPVVPLQPRPLADRLEKFLRGFRDPDEALAAFGHHSFVAEESERGVEALAGGGVAPTRKTREEPVAADRLPGFLQGGQDVFDGLQGRVGTWPSIIEAGYSCGLRHAGHYMHLSSICILVSPTYS